MDVKLYHFLTNNNHFIIYEPLSGYALYTDAKHHEILSQWLAKYSMSCNSKNLIPEAVCHFKPVRMTLLPTNQCNLRCRYCYASAGEDNRSMSWPVAKGAIDFVAANALKRGESQFEVYFHGGGEPTVAWPFICEVQKYASSVAVANGLNVAYGIATNGIFNASFAEKIVNTFQLVSLSFDGPQDVHDKNRVFPDGSGSFDRVLRTAQLFDSLKFTNYSIVSTVTDKTIEKIEDTLEFFKNNCMTREIHIGPMVAAGRGTQGGSQAPDFNRSLSYYRKAIDAAWRLGLSVSYPGINPEFLTANYCGVAGPNLFVTAEGLISRCLEVCNSKHPRCDKFIIGSISDEGEIKIYEDRISTLQKRNVNNLHHCQDCVLKWHCAGDCPARVLNPEKIEISTTDESRCDLKRALFWHRLLRFALDGVPYQPWTCPVERYIIGPNGDDYEIKLVEGSLGEENHILVRFVRKEKPGHHITDESLFIDAIATCPGG